MGARLRRAFDNVADRRALARCFINGGAGAACEPAHQKARRTVRIMHIAAARTAGASGLFVFLADVAIAAQAGALKPCCVVELSGLDVKTDGYQTELADGIGRRAAAATAAEVTHDRLAFYDENPAAVAVMIPVAVPIAIVVLR